jgi:hypothetical protein
VSPIYKIAEAILKAILKNRSHFAGFVGAEFQHQKSLGIGAIPIEAYLRYRTLFITVRGMRLLAIFFFLNPT